MNNVKDFGAKGDGITNDTIAIQRAIDAGGTVYFPAGKYLTGTLYLRSHGGLELDQSAIILTSMDEKDYNDPAVPAIMESMKACGESNRHLIIAENVENVYIRGGTFDGRGCEIYKSREMMYTNSGLGPLWKYVVGFRPAQMMVFCGCKNIRLKEFTIHDASGWSCFLYDCANAHIDSIRIRNSPYIGENDGIDIDCCSHVVVSNCDIDVGDDAFTLRGCDGRLAVKHPCEWVSVSNCILRSAYAHGIRVGVGNGEIRNCQFDNISVLDSHIAVHINTKYSDGAPGTEAPGVDIHDLAFRNFHVDVGQFLFIRLDYRFAQTPASKSTYNITFDNIDGTVRQPNMLRGNGVGTIHDICFNNVQLNVAGNNEHLPNDRKFCMIEGTDGIFELNQVQNVNFFNVRLKYEHSECWKTDIAETNCNNIIKSCCNLPHEK